MKKPNHRSTKGQQKPRAVKKASRRVGAKNEAKKAAPATGEIKDETVKSLKEVAGF